MTPRAVPAPATIPGVGAASQLGSGGYGAVWRFHDALGVALPLVCKVSNLKNVRDPAARRTIADSYERERRFLTRVSDVEAGGVGKYRDSIVTYRGQMPADALRELDIIGTPVKLERVLDASSAENNLVVDYVGPDLNHIFYNSKRQLGEFLTKDPNEGERRLLTVAESLAGAIAVCHREGFFHFDVKPANLLLDERVLTSPSAAVSTSQIKLADFGNAHGLDEGMPANVTPDYAHPYASHSNRPVTGEVKPTAELDMESVRRTLKSLLSAPNLAEAMGPDFKNSPLHILYRHQVSDANELLALVEFTRDQAKAKPTTDVYWQSFGAKVLSPSIARNPRRAVLEVLALPELRSRLVEGQDPMGLTLEARVKLHVDAMSLRRELISLASETVANVDALLRDRTNDATGGTMLYQPMVKNQGDMQELITQLDRLIANTGPR